MPSILDDLKSEFLIILESNKPRAFKSPHQNITLAFHRATQQFKEIGRVQPHVEYRLVHQFLSGSIPKSHPSFDLLGDMILVPINGDSGNAIFFSNTQLKLLLDTYKDKIEAGADLQITWKSLFHNFLILNNHDDVPIFDKQLELLRSFLESTWPQIKKKSPRLLYELRFVDKYSIVLEPNSWEHFSQVWLDGLSQRVIQMTEDLEIPTTSWFWEKLFIHTLQMIVNFEDEAFKKTIPYLITLLEKCPLYQDLGIELMLDRFSRLQSPLMHTQFMDFVIRSWGSPVGVINHKSAWKQISDNSIRLAKSWHHERNLRIFYALKTGEKIICQQKLDFWLNYLDQIETSRLALGSVGQKIVQSQSSLQRIFHPQTNPFSKLTGDIHPEQNALIMKINNMIVVDFILADGCFIYEPGSNTFEIDQESHYSTTYKGGLKERYGKYGVTISEIQDWTDISYLKSLMSKYGIH